MRFKIFILLFTISFNTVAYDKEFIVAIDIGHSKSKSGAMSSRGIGEFYFNKTIAKKLLAKLQANKLHNSFIINPDGQDISLTERVKIAEQKNADILISIHHDSVQPKYLSYWEYKNATHHYSDFFSGYSLFISTKDINGKESLRLATKIGKELIEHGFIYSKHHAEKIEGENRKIINDELGIYEFNELVVLKKSSIPAVLIECGIIVNRQEEELLSDENYQNKLVDSIYKGIESFLF